MHHDPTYNVVFYFGRSPTQAAIDAMVKFEAEHKNQRPRVGLTFSAYSRLEGEKPLLVFAQTDKDDVFKMHKAGWLPQGVPLEPPLMPGEEPGSSLVSLTMAITIITQLQVIVQHALANNMVVGRGLEVGPGHVVQLCEGQQFSAIISPTSCIRYTSFGLVKQALKRSYDEDPISRVQTWIRLLDSVEDQIVRLGP